MTLSVGYLRYTKLLFRRFENMKTLVLCGKPQHLKMVMNSYPESVTQGEVVAGYFFTYVGSPFVYPNNLKYKDLPFTKEPEYRLETGFSEHNGSKYPFMRFYKCNEDLCFNASNELPHSNMLSLESRRSFLNSFDKIVLSGDANGSGEFGARLFLRLCGVEDDDIRIQRMIMAGGTDKKSIAGFWSNLYTLQDEIPMQFQNRARTKRYFEYNFNMMSNVVFSDLLRHIGVSNQSRTFTKYQLMMIHILSKNPGITTSEAMYLMSNYRGTGLFHKYLSGIGSAASRSQILENLADLDLIDVSRNADCSYFRLVGKSPIHLSEKGLRLLNSLHKKTFDPDLPLRLGDWGANFSEENFSKIDRYLKTLFGKQIRHQSKFICGNDNMTPILVP